MKFSKSFALMAFALALGFVFSVNAFADSGTPTELPSWFVAIANALVSFPVVGPFLLGALKYASILSAVFTALATFVLAVSRAVVGVARLQGFISFAAKFQAFHDKVWPWLAYLSMYNVQKNQSGAGPKV